MHGHAACVVKLALAGARLDSHSKWTSGNTPLHMAVWNGHRDCVLGLADAGEASNQRYGLDQQNEEGDTPLHFAVMSGDIVMVELLCSLGSDPTLKNSQGQTALDQAVADGGTDSANVIRKYAAGFEVYRAAEANEVSKLQRLVAGPFRDDYAHPKVSLLQVCQVSWHRAESRAPRHLDRVDATACGSKRREPRQYGSTDLCKRKT